MKIALEMAEVMRFLHSQDAQIIVPNFSSSNVLLDLVCGLQNFFPFGLTK